MQQRKTYIRVEWLTSNRDKAANARGFQALASMGKVFIPRTEWGDALIDQLASFPAGKFDDKVDVCGLFGRLLDQTYGPRDKTPEAPTHRDTYGCDDDEANDWKSG
jgi:phage terminase large subunit-like protein